MVVLMDSRQTVERLNELLQIHIRSLPVYLSHARPWAPWGQERAVDVLRDVAEDQLQRVDQIAHYVQDLGGMVQTGEFPMEYTDLHDLSLDYVLKVVKQRHRRDVSRIEQLISELAEDPRAAALAQESLGAAKAHLQSLEELNEQTGVQAAS